MCLYNPILSPFFYSTITQYKLVVVGWSIEEIKKKPFHFPGN